MCQCAVIFLIINSYSYFIRSPLLQHIILHMTVKNRCFQPESICFHSRRYWMLRPMQISSYLILFSCVIYVCAKCELEWDSFVTQVLLPMRNDDAMKREKTLEIRT